MVTLRFGSQETPLTGRAGASRLSFQDVFVRQIDDFAAAIREGREPHVSGREGRRSLELIEACWAARRPLELPWSNPPELASWEGR